MGTINYKTSDYITLGVEPYDVADFVNDSEFISWAEELNIDTRDEAATISAAYDVINQYYFEDMANVKAILNRYSFYHYHVTIEPGYYEGFSLNIENNYPVAFDSWEDKREAQKEITQIKAFLKECAGVGLVEVWPGWCTTYRSYPETIAAINEAVKDMREEARRTPTWLWYERDQYAPGW